MGALRQLTIRTRFYLLITLISVALLALGIWGLLTSRAETDRVGQLFDQSYAASDKVQTLREALGSVLRLQSGVIAVGSSNAVEVERLLALWKAELGRVRAAGQELVRGDPGNTALAELVQSQGQQLNEYSAAIGPLLDKLLAATIDGNVALAYAEQAAGTVTALQKSSDAILSVQQQAQKALRDSLAQSALRMAWLRLALLGLTLALVLPTLWLTLRSVCAPLEEAVRVADRITAGDLSESLQVQGADEAAHLLRSLQAMQGSLRSLVGQVRQSVDSIQVSSSEVASGNLDLSQRTEQAASNLQQTASSIHQITGNVSQSADAAQQANQLASSATDVAQRGGAVVARVVATMEEINTSSKKIADIISVIDGIAFQTNILALNAAVEAARAGEQGRGFAVVASEVRSLAQRSAQAAREIKGLIGNSVDRVETGARLVQDAGSTMGDIVASVQRVTAIVGTISSAASHQSTDLDQVNRSVSELDRMTQQNAALVEQSSAAAASLNEQAQSLAALVARFRLMPAAA